MKLVCAVSINPKVSFLLVIVKTIISSHFPWILKLPLNGSYNGDFVLKNVWNYKFKKTITMIIILEQHFEIIFMYVIWRHLNFLFYVIMINRLERETLCIITLILDILNLTKLLQSEQIAFDSNYKRIYPLWPIWKKCITIERYWRNRKIILFYCFLYDDKLRQRYITHK